MILRHARRHGVFFRQKSPKTSPQIPTFSQNDVLVGIKIVKFFSGDDGENTGADEYDGQESVERRKSPAKA